MGGQQLDDTIRPLSQVPGGWHPIGDQPNLEAHRLLGGVVNPVWWRDLCQEGGNRRTCVCVRVYFASDFAAGCGFRERILIRKLYGKDLLPGLNNQMCLCRLLAQQRC